jgi:hypothetical protein
MKRPRQLPTGVLFCYRSEIFSAAVCEVVFMGMNLVVTGIE